MKAIRVLKATSEDWHPSYKLSGWYQGKKSPTFVEVAFHGGLSDGKTFRTSVWGGDDFGMDFDTGTHAEALEMFLYVIGLDDVTEAILRAAGFVNG